MKESLLLVGLGLISGLPEVLSSSPLWPKPVEEQLGEGQAQLSPDFLVCTCALCSLLSAHMLNVTTLSRGSLFSLSVVPLDEAFCVSGSGGCALS